MIYLHRGYPVRIIIIYRNDIYPSFISRADAYVWPSLMAGEECIDSLVSRVLCLVDFVRHWSLYAIVCSNLETVVTESADKKVLCFQRPCRPC